MSIRLLRHSSHNFTDENIQGPSIVKANQYAQWEDVPIAYPVSNFLPFFVACMSAS